MKRSLAAAIVAMVSGTCAIAAPDTYPSQPITFLVPYAAGGPTDTVARLLAEAMGRRLGGRIIVENVAGAGGTLGSGRVAKAEPNGYTLLLNHIGMATSVTLYPGASYDPVAAFEPIGLIVDVPMTLVGRASLEPNSLAELVSFVRRGEGRATYAHAGPGTASHLCGTMFLAATHMTATAVPYRGTGPAMSDLVGGQVDFMCDQTTNTTTFIRSGHVKAYVTTRVARIPTLPEVPSAPEAGFATLDLSIWHGLYAPKGTPAEIRQKLEVALAGALNDAALIARFAELGGIVVAPGERTPAALRTKLAQEIARWRGVLAPSQ